MTDDVNDEDFNIFIDMKDEVFAYLDELRLSGITNMFGASVYLVKEFDLNPQEARKFLKMWIEAFEE